MKKIVVLLLVVVLGLSLWWNLRNLGGIQIGMLTGKTTTLERGDLTIPITANGKIEPRERVEIKSEAGGVVIQTPVEISRFVEEGELLVELDPEDEQRRVDIAGKALAQAEINLRRASNTLYQREKVDVPAMQAQLEAVLADLSYRKWRVEEDRLLKQKGRVHEDEFRQKESTLQQRRAERDRLDAECDRARKNVEMAILQVEEAELAVARAKDDLADAEERLSETRIVAPSEGILSRLLVKRGTVITSGSSSFGGGTLLATIADVSQLFVKAQVDESDIGRVLELAPTPARPGYQGDPQIASTDGYLPSTAGSSAISGTPVKITVDAFPDEEFRGVIDLIEPEPDPSQVIVTYVVRIRITSDNADRLMLGMQANVEFVSQSVEDVVLIPNEAVRIVGDEHGVYIPVPSEREPGKTYPRFQPFRPGLDNGRYTQVLSGLAEGDEVYLKLPINPRNGQEVTGEPTAD